MDGARMGLSVGGGGGTTMTVVDNTFRNVSIGVRGFSAITELTIAENDFTNYTTSALGPFFSEGGLICNWWGDPAGPQNIDAGIPMSAFTPWAVVPVAGVDPPDCSGG